MQFLVKYYIICIFKEDHLCIMSHYRIPYWEVILIILKKCRFTSTILSFFLLFCLIVNTPVFAATKQYVYIYNKISQLTVDDSYQFRVRTCGLNTPELKWESNAPLKATVSETGKVIAKDAGTVTITVTDLVSKKKSYCTFRIRQKETPVSLLKYSIINNEITIHGLKESCSSLILPDKINGLPVTRISQGAFYKNKTLTLIDLPYTLKTIDAQAFRGCTSLKTVYFPSQMENLGDYLFYDCTSLTSLYFPKKCTTVSERILTGSNLEFCSLRQAALELNADIFLSNEDTLLLEHMKELLKTIVSESDTDAEKVRKIHNWITSNCSYDTAVLQDGSTIDPDSYTVYGVMNNHKAVCAGYAETFSLFMKLCNIPSIYITGKADNVGHAWNLVKISNHWYHVDTTWDDPIPERNTLFYNYLLTSDKSMKKTHTWDAQKYPVCSSDQYRYYAYKDCIVDTMSESKKVLNALNITDGEWTTVLFPEKVNLQNVLYDCGIDYTKLGYFSPKQIGDYFCYTFYIN